MYFYEFEFCVAKILNIHRKELKVLGALWGSEVKNGHPMRAGIIQQTRTLDQ